MFEWGNCIFAAQIVAAECLFMYSYPKRGMFWLRLVSGIAACMLLSGLYPAVPYSNSFEIQAFQFLKYIFIFAVTVAAMGFCFKVKAAALISACTAAYALQHFSYQLMRLVSFIPFWAEIATIEREHYIELLIFPFTYAAAWAVFGRMAAKHEFYKNYDIRLILVSIFTLFVCLIINRFARQGNTTGNIYVLISNALYAMSCCMLSLFISYNLHVLSITRAQNETLERIGYEERRQFEASKKNREQLNIKYHDLKHVLSLLEGDRNAEVLAQYKKVIEEYDSEVRTGNETLDIVINEKADTCRAEGIAFTFLGNGELRAFISQYDLYSLFGNILDNAVEAVRKIEDRAKRIISVTVERHGNCVAVSAMNYFAGDIKLNDGLPVTTKTANMDSHGFGVRSIKLVAEKYGGGVEFTANDGIFDLNVYMFAPQNECREAEEEQAAEV